MIKRTFTKGEQTAVLLAPSGDWRDRWFSVTVDGHEWRREFDSNRNARDEASGALARLLANGWREVVATAGAEPVDQRAAPARLDEQHIAIIADRFAFELAASAQPDWNAIWDRTAEYSRIAAERKRILSATQAAYQRRRDESTREARMLRLAQEKAQDAATIANEREAERRKVEALAQRLRGGSVPAADGQRRIDFEE